MNSNGVFYLNRLCVKGWENSLSHPPPQETKNLREKKEKGVRTRDRVSENLKSKNQAVNLFSDSS